MRRVAVILCVLPVSALAQSVNLEARESVGGFAVPFASVATTEGPFSLGVNPAALAFSWSGVAAGFESGTGFGGGRQGTALYLTGGGRTPTSNAELAYGASVDWMQESSLVSCAATPCYRRTNFGGALTTGNLALGLAWRMFAHQRDPAFDSVHHLDFGFLWRPFRWLSVGGVLPAFNVPVFPTVDFKPLMTLAVGLRPFTDRVTYSADWTMAPRSFGGLGRLSHTLRLGVFDGLDVVGQVTHGLDVSGPMTFQVGLQAALWGMPLGVSVASQTGGGTPLAFGITGSSGHGNAPAFLGAPARAWRLDLPRSLEGPSQVEQVLGLVDESEPSPYVRLAMRLEKLALDPPPGVLVLELQTLDGMTLGRMRELREYVLRIRAKGTKVLAWLGSGGDAEYLLASAADRIVAAPQVMLNINGLGSQRIYLRGALDKLGVVPEFVKIGQYKSAPEQFTNETASEGAKEQTKAILDDQYARYVDDLAKARGLAPDKIRELLSRGLLVSERALEAGLIDAISPRGKALDAEVTILAKEDLTQERLGPALDAVDPWSTLPTIGLVEITGNIVTSPHSPSNGFTGGEAVARQVEALARDPNVVAIVVRIDSPGGEVSASELIYQAFAAVKGRKPIVASMGDVAASGGYYVACIADEIVAEPSTITGSIGVFAGKADLSGLLGKLGVTTEIDRRGSPDLMSLYRPWTETERATMETVVGDFYETFLKRVAVGRGMSRDDVHAVAQGRVWTGAQARERRLVDTFGGLETALSAAKRRAGLPVEAAVKVAGIAGRFEGFETVPAAGMVSALIPEALRRTIAGRLAGLVREQGVGTDRRLEQLWPMVHALAEGRPLALALDVPLD